MLPLSISQIKTLKCQWPNQKIEEKHIALSN